MEIKFDQLAVVARDLVAQRAALAVADFPVHDIVAACGIGAWGQRINNIAELAFNYTLWPMEYEVLRYTAGWNWHKAAGGTENVMTSHFGVHVQTNEEVDAIRALFPRLPLQEVVTVDHGNPACAERRYHYVILDAREQLGCALKVIRRLTLEEGAATLAKLLERTK